METRMKEHILDYSQGHQEEVRRREVRTLLCSEMI